MVDFVNKVSLVAEANIIEAESGNRKMGNNNGFGVRIHTTVSLMT